MEGHDVGNEAQTSKEFPVDAFEAMSKTVDGVFLPNVFPTENIRQALNYRAHDGDLIIATFPKCGTTWATYIVCNLLYFDQYGEGSMSPPPMLQCPFIEAQGLEKVKAGGIYKTHFPFDAKRFNPRAKYIVVMRNPRDTCTSFYHHCTNMIPEAIAKPKGFWFPTFAKMFISNRTWYGDYFEHVLSWLDGPPAAGATKDDMLYVTYEEMKAHPREELIRIANFIGGQAAERVKDEKVVNEILSRTSLKSMKEEINPNMGKFIRSLRTSEDAHLIPDHLEFVRKGEVGDWKNHFTPEISAEFDAWIASKPEHEKVMKLFEGVTKSN